MATFLDLCGKVARESGAAGRPPASVIGQTGRAEKVVEWVRTAWEDIQNAKPDWLFMQGQWSGDLVDGTATYTAASFGITRFGEWLVDTPGYRPTTIYDPAIGRSDESRLNYVSWQYWRNSYDIGHHDEQRPVVYAISPDGSISFGATPDKAYKVRGEYRKTPQVLAANSDVPDMPVRFHDVIVWKALILMADHDEAQFARETAQLKYRELMTAMTRDLLPRITVYNEGPLA